MGAVRLLVRSELRRRWRSLVIVVLLVGFGAEPRSRLWPGRAGPRLIRPLPIQHPEP